MRKLRAYFLAGLVVTAPIGITIWLAWWFVSLFDRWIKPLIPAVYNPDHYLPFSVPGVGLLLAIIGITLIGALAANLVGRTMIRTWESLLNKMPVVRTIYRGIKQIFQTALAQSGNNFQSVGLIEYPRRGTHVVVFIARELDSGEIGLPAGQAMMSAFMPTTPNPTSGFLFFLHVEEVQILDISVEDGAKLVISAGLVTPADGKMGKVDNAQAAEFLTKAGKAAKAAPIKKAPPKKVVKKSPARKTSQRPKAAPLRRAQKDKAKP